jgi:hypothetical protein
MTENLYKQPCLKRDSNPQNKSPLNLRPPAAYVIWNLRNEALPNRNLRNPRNPREDQIEADEMDGEWWGGG